LGTFPDECPRCHSNSDAWMDFFEIDDGLGHCWMGLVTVVCLECSRIVFETDYHGNVIPE